jgi:hypothetical protein
VQLQVQSEIPPNEWVSVRISEREDAVIGEMTPSVTAGAV